MMQLYGGLDETTDQTSPDREAPQWNPAGKLFSEWRQKRNGIQKERRSEVDQHEGNSGNSGKFREQDNVTEVRERESQ